MHRHDIHPLALKVDRPSPEDEERLRQDIKRNGLLEPIVLLDDKILDGVTREGICHQLGIEPHYVAYDGSLPEDPAAFVFAKNVARRHLTKSQIAMLRVDLIEKSKMGRPTASEKSRVADATFPGATEVHPSTLRMARQVKRERPDLAKKVRSGDMTLNAAKTTIREDKRRAGTWNGKSRTARKREIRDELAKGNYSKLLNLQMEMTKLVAVVSDWKPAEFELDQATLALVDSFYDDLVTLGEWHDRAVLATQAWLSSVAVRKKIEALRDTKGRPAEEAKTARRLADRLERKLQSNLNA